MYNIKQLRDDTENIRRGLERRGEAHRLDPILELDERRREIISQVEVLKQQRNTASRQIGEMMKSGRKDEANGMRESVRQIGERIRDFDEELKAVEKQMNDQIAWLPNIPHYTTPDGLSEKDNVVRKEVGEKPAFGFPVKDHLELGQELGILDFERGAKITGSGFPVYVGQGAALERALLNFMLNLHTREHGYREIFPPFLVNPESLFGTGQIPKLEEDMYKCRDDEFYLIPTAEVPVTNMHRDEVIPEKELPIKYVGFTACFRREAGSYGKETRGFLRVHQFNKVELVQIVRPEESYEIHETLTRQAERVLEMLEIPYRRLELCAGDLGFSAAKCYDLETWSPANDKWLEASSCSNFEDFQARRMNIRYRPEGESKTRYVHTLNGSGLATSRLMVSLLENYQTDLGTIMVPKPLVEYTGFSEIKAEGLR